MKYILGALLLTALAIAGARVSDADPPDQGSFHPVAPLMRMKLEKSKAILEGLTLEDYDAVAKNAKSLRVLSLESGWNVFHTEEYDAQSREFRRGADMIAEAAIDKDISRATLGYVALTVRCVECHSYMRKHKTQLMKLEPN